MSTLIYSMSVSLDGYIAALDGSIDFATPDAELMAFHNEQSRRLSAHFTGRKLYEDMLPWETEGESRADASAAEFARIWKRIPKVVFTTTLTEVQGNATLARGSITDEAKRVRDRQDELVSVGGAGLAAGLVDEDLLDEYRLFVHPVVLGGGTPFFPESRRRLELQLVEQRLFESGVVYLRYRRSRRAD